jgi:hypothetical protein
MKYGLCWVGINRIYLFRQLSMQNQNIALNHNPFGRIEVKAFEEA